MKYIQCNFEISGLWVSRLSSVGWAGLTQSVKGLTRTKADLLQKRRDSSRRLPLDSNCNSFLLLQPAGLLHSILNSQNLHHLMCKFPLARYTHPVGSASLRTPTHTDAFTP